MDVLPTFYVSNLAVPVKSKFPPPLKGDGIPLFEKEGLGESFIPLCDGGSS
jgi:hypothetical protein